MGILQEITWFVSPHASKKYTNGPVVAILKYGIFSVVGGIVYLISSCVLNFCDLSPVEQMTSSSLEDAL